jgi:hypothetical protein
MAKPSGTSTYDRNKLPPIFPGPAYPLPAGLRAQVESYCAQRDEDPASFIADAIALALDELAGAIMDERELGFASLEGEAEPEPAGAPSAERGHTHRAAGAPARAEQEDDP